jgi:hypothetical protein
LAGEEEEEEAAVWPVRRRCKFFVRWPHASKV